MLGKGRWLALGLCFAASSAHGEDKCGTYPDEVHALALGWFDCEMKRGGEAPLWRGLTSPEYVRQVRFTFVPGRFFTKPSLNFFRVIRFNERQDGSGVVETVKYLQRNDKKGYRRSATTRHQVSVEATSQLNVLAEQSGTWDFATGTWDGEEIFLHCANLEMERVDARGYRYSSVNISCNRPQKLMPLVEHLTALAQLQPTRDGRY